MQFGVTPAWLMGYNVPKKMNKSATVLGSGLTEAQNQLINYIQTLNPSDVDALLAIVRSLRNRGR